MMLEKDEEDKDKDNDNDSDIGLTASQIREKHARPEEPDPESEEEEDNKNDQSELKPVRLNTLGQAAPPDLKNLLGADKGKGPQGRPKNILTNNSKLEWEMNNRQDAIQKKIEDMKKLKDKANELPVVNQRKIEMERLKQEQLEEAERNKRSITTNDRKIKIIGQEKNAKFGKDQSYFYPESAVGRDERKQIPNAFERKKIREDIKVILDNNFNIELNLSKR